MYQITSWRSLYEYGVCFFVAWPLKVFEKTEIEVTDDRVQSSAVYLGQAEVYDTAVRIHYRFLRIS